MTMRTNFACKNGDRVMYVKNAFYQAQHHVLKYGLKELSWHWLGDLQGFIVVGVFC